MSWQLVDRNYVLVLIILSNLPSFAGQARHVKKEALTRRLIMLTRPRDGFRGPVSLWAAEAEGVADMCE